MIEINLAKSIHGKSELNSLFSLEFDFELIKEIFIICAKVSLLVFGILIFEKTYLYLLREKVSQKEIKKNQLDQKIKSYGDVALVVEDLAKKRKEMKRKIETLKKVSGKMKSKIDLLIKIQNSIHQDLWFTELKFSKESVLVKGLSHSILGVKDTVKAIEKLEKIESVSSPKIDRKERGSTYEKQKMKFEMELRLQKYVN